MRQLNQVLELIRPNCEYTVDATGSLHWLDTNTAAPTAQELADGVELLQDLSYREVRRPLYPALSDFADAFVHERNGNPVPMQEYVARCLAVKAQHPKPE